LMTTVLHAMLRFMARRVGQSDPPFMGFGARASSRLICDAPFATVRA